jgi:hypothetical protein
LKIELFVNPLSAEDAQWQSLAAGALARAYGEDEPDYSAADVGC